MTDLNTQINCISLECGTTPIFEKRLDCNASLPPLCSNTTLGKTMGSFMYIMSYMVLHVATILFLCLMYDNANYLG